MTAQASTDVPTSRGPVLPPPSLFIGADVLTSSSGGTVHHVNPATGAEQGTVLLGGADEMAAAVQAARTALPAWRRTSHSERRRLLHALAEAVSDNAEELAIITSLETGKPIVQARAGAFLREWIAYYAGWADKIAGTTVTNSFVDGMDYVIPEPYGVVGVIVPWSGPLSGVVMGAVPALAAGNTVVVKPASLAPFACLRFAQLALDVGIPPGVLNVVVGDEVPGEVLVRHPDVDKIVFTGGPATARRVLNGAAAPLTPTLLELGGKSASIVLPDANVATTAELTVRLGIAASAGQGCALPTRSIVHSSIYDEFVEEVVARTAQIRVGQPLDPSTTMGPVISESALDRIRGIVGRCVERGEGLLRIGGHRLGGDLERGFFMAPTVLVDVAPGCELEQEEIFGPVHAITAYDTLDEAVDRANSTRYGLAAYIHTANLSAAHRLASEVQAGYVSINGFAGLTPTAPFGGTKESGYGRQGGFAGLTEFVRTKNVFVAL